MAGRKPKLEQIKGAFLAEVNSAQNLVLAIQNVPTSVTPRVTPYLHPKYKVQVVELAFMAVVSAWEEFLEATLVRYVAGAKTASGYSPTPKFGLASNLTHAYQVLSDKPNFNPTSDYLKVSNPAWVRQKAGFIFSTHPYTVLSTKAQLLDSANKIRNRVAHSSLKCKADFKNVALHLLNLPAAGSLKQSFTAGDLLLTPTTVRFTGAHPGSNHFQEFLRMYTNLADVIVP